MEKTSAADGTIGLVFAGDDVRLYGQIDYPDSPPPSDGYPLIFILHHAGCNSLSWYSPFARVGLQNGYAVFRWDKRGTGRSGAGGRGSAAQDAVNAYEIALEQPHINRKRAVILAQDAGTGLLGHAFGLFARLQKPHGVILATNTLEPQEVLALDTHVHIIMSETDWNPWQQYAQGACEAHMAAYHDHDASFYVVPGKVDRTLIEADSLPPTASSILTDWLQDLCRPSKLI
jgi:hypothetical protein